MDIVMSTENIFDQIVSMYTKEKLSLKAIADKIGVLSRESIRQQLISRGVTMRPRGRITGNVLPTFTALNAREIVQIAQLHGARNVAVADLAKWFNVSHKTIIKALKACKVSIKRQRRESLTQDEIRQIVAAVKSGEKQKDVAAKFAVSTATVSTLWTSSHRLSPAGVNTLDALYTHKQQTQQRVGETIRTPQSVVSCMLRVNGIHTRPRGRRPGVKSEK